MSAGGGTANAGAGVGAAGSTASSVTNQSVSVGFGMPFAALNDPWRFRQIDTWLDALRWGSRPPQITTREEWGARYPRNHPDWSAPNVHGIYWGPGSLGTPTGIVFHHTVGGFNLFDYRERSTPYHFIIAPCGGIYEGRPMGHLGDHVGGANTGNIGIAFTGTFAVEGSMPTARALANAEHLVSYLRHQNPTIVNFYAHSDFPGWENQGDFAGNQRMLNWIRAFR